MAENTNDSQVVETEEELTNYTTETNAGAGTGTSAIEPGYGTGRRKEAVARVPSGSGDGKWTINSRTLEVLPSSCSVRSTPDRSAHSPKASSTRYRPRWAAAPPARPAPSTSALPAL